MFLNKFYTFVGCQKNFMIEYALSNTVVVDIILRFLFNLICIFIIANGMYLRKYKNKEFYFTFVLFNIIIFMLCALLRNAGIDIGFAFGLFAIFSIFRYRTVTIPVREMGYFFVSVAAGIINSVALVDLEFTPYYLALINLVLIGVIYLLDASHKVTYENSHNLIINDFSSIHMSADQGELLKALEIKTGYKYHHVDIMKVDFAKNIGRVKAYYYSERPINDNIDRDDD